MPMSYSDLGQKVKAKYPQYASIPDDQLGQKVAAKHPEYQSLVTQTAPQSNPVVDAAEKIGAGARDIFFPGVNTLGKSLGQAAGMAATQGFDTQTAQQNTDTAQKYMNMAKSAKGSPLSQNFYNQAQRVGGLNTQAANAQTQAAQTGKWNAVRGGIGTAGDVIAYGSKIPGLNAPAGIMNVGADAGIPAKMGAAIINMLPANIFRGATAGAGYEGSTPTSVAKSAGTSAAVGSALEALTSGVLPALGGAFNWTKESLNQPADAINKSLDRVDTLAKLKQVGEGNLQEAILAPGTDGNLLDTTLGEHIHSTDPTVTQSNLSDLLQSVHEAKSNILGSSPANEANAQKLSELIGQVKDAALNAGSGAEKLQLDQLARQLDSVNPAVPLPSATDVSGAAATLAGFRPSAPSDAFQAAAPLTSDISDVSAVGQGGFTIDKNGAWTPVTPPAPVPGTGETAVAPEAQAPAGLEKLQSQAQEALPLPQQKAKLTDLEEARQILGKHIFTNGNSPELTSSYFNLRDFIREGAGNPDQLSQLDDSSQSVMKAQGQLKNYFAQIGAAGGQIPQEIADPQSVKRAIMTKSVPNAFSNVMSVPLGVAGGIGGMALGSTAGVLPAGMGLMSGAFIGRQAARGAFENPSVITGLSNLLNNVSDTAGPIASQLSNPTLARLLGPFLSAAASHQADQNNQPTP